MECKNQYEEDVFDENLGCFHKDVFCKLNKKSCRGSEGVCSKFEAIEKKVEEKVEKMAKETIEEDEEAEEEGEEES